MLLCTPFSAASAKPVGLVRPDIIAQGGLRCDLIGDIQNGSGLGGLRREQAKGSLFCAPSAVYDFMLRGDIFCDGMEMSLLCGYAVKGQLNVLRQFCCGVYPFHKGHLLS